MRSSERTIKRLGEIIAGDEAVSEDPGRLVITNLGNVESDRRLFAERLIQKQLALLLGKFRTRTSNAL